ncbi:MAG: branched-chain amino acid ABC transporter permease [Xanthobacteraceae bacterium]|nr:MAG: branched-chain amino acid ABC transporter permease [Xanthobacteraceae bacterium]
MSDQVHPTQLSTVMLQPASRSARTIFVSALLAVAIIIFPFFATPFHLDVANQILLASIGALSLMLLTGFAGQISLGHAGLIAAGAFTAGILSKEAGAPFWIGIPAAGATGGLLGLIFGLPSLRLRGVYLAVSTLALHFIVVYAGGEYENLVGGSGGILIPPPSLWGLKINTGKAWYVLLVAGAILAFLVTWNVVRSRTGRAFAAVHGRETVAAALGINVARTKLTAFVISSSMTAIAGALFAYYRGFVSIEAFSLYLSIQYIAMIIIGGIGTLPGAFLGALFVTLLPYLIETVVAHLPGAQAMAGSIFAVNYAAFGLVMIVFLVFEPSGLVGLWRRLERRLLIGRQSP